MKIISVVGTRPNFMKIAPFIKAINKHNTLYANSIEHWLVHTGQHYDDRMSQSFFEQLEIPVADINLGIGSGSHAEQVGNNIKLIRKEYKIALKNPRKPVRPELWDGHTADRCLKAILDFNKSS